MNIRDVVAGTRWYVQLAPGATLVEREVLETTEKTILLRNPNCKSSYDTARYPYADITLVERY